MIRKTRNKCELKIYIHHLNMATICYNRSIREQLHNTKINKI